MGALLGAGSIIGGAGSLFGGIFGSIAAANAAKQQLAAEKQAEGTLQNSENQALTYQQNATNSGLSNLQPYLQGGATAEGSLSQLLGTPGKGLLTPWTQTFTAPTAAQAAQTPGYQFQLQQGEQALQNSAAAQGGLLSGNTLAGMNQYAQGLASSNYQNVFNNALTQYQSAYNTFQNNQANQYNMLSGQAGVGQNAATSANSLLQAGANNYGAITTNTGADIASLLNQGGAASAAGTLGSAQALSSIAPGVSNSLLNYGLLNQLNGSSTANPFGGSLTSATSTAQGPIATSGYNTVPNFGSSQYGSLSGMNPYATGQLQLPQVQ
jgi:hypothetical protein